MQRDDLILIKLTEPVDKLEAFRARARAAIAAAQ